MRYQRTIKLGDSARRINMNKPVKNIDDLAKRICTNEYKPKVSEGQLSPEEIKVAQEEVGRAIDKFRLDFNGAVIGELQSRGLNVDLVDIMTDQVEFAADRTFYKNESLYLFYLDKTLDFIDKLDKKGLRCNSEAH